MPADLTYAAQLGGVLASLYNACHAAQENAVCYCDDEMLDGQLCHVCKCRKAIAMADQLETPKQGT